jgi:ABC-type transporter lipoprotein component MlaA
MSLYWHPTDRGWTVVFPSTNTLRSMPAQFENYDSVTQDAVDKYEAAKNAYISKRDAEAKR